MIGSGPPNLASSEAEVALVGGLSRLVGPHFFAVITARPFAGELVFRLAGRATEQPELRGGFSQGQLPDSQKCATCH